MPFATHDGTRIYWKMDGVAERPVLVLLNSIGTDMGLWDGCVARLTPSFRTLRIDTRGHGASDVPGGDYGLETLARDVLAVLDAAGVQSAAVAGVSLGGMIAMQLALIAPERVSALVPICTSVTMDSAAWADRVAAVREGGTAAIAEMAMGRFLSPGFMRTHPEVCDTVRSALIAQDRDGYAGAAAAIRDMDLAARIGAIAVPTLVIGGDRDVSTPFVGHGRYIVEAIPGAREAHVDAGHLPPLEVPGALVTAIRDFLCRDEAAELAGDTLFEAGLLNRRRVLGDAWVDKSLAARTPFNADFQAMITRIAWGEIWGRPGLEDRTRRFLVLAITAALGRWEEFGLHVRSGLQQGGFNVDELKEVLMQTAIYAGVPAANTGFAEAMKIMKELDAA